MKIKELATLLSLLGTAGDDIEVELTVRLETGNTALLDLVRDHNSLNMCSIQIQPDLSRRERQVFNEIAKGTSPAVIASKLSLSVKTVSTYRQRILEKMGMRSNAEIAVYATKNGLLEDTTPIAAQPAQVEAVA